MTTITLTPEIEQALKNEARRQGTTLESLALACLRERFLSSVGSEPLTEQQGTLADFLNGYVGVLSSSEHVPGGARLSEESGRKFTAGLKKRREQGRL